MKYPVRYLFAIVAFVAMAVQGGRALWEWREVTTLKIRSDEVTGKHQRLNECWRDLQVRAQRCRQINDRYEYPGDLAAAERRHQQLPQREAGR